MGPQGHGLVHGALDPGYLGVEALGCRLSKVVTHDVGAHLKMLAVQPVPGLWQLAVDVTPVVAEVDAIHAKPGAEVDEVCHAHTPGLTILMQAVDCYTHLHRSSLLPEAQYTSVATEPGGHPCAMARH